MIKYLTSILVVIALSCNATKKNASKTESSRTDKKKVESNVKIQTDSFSIGSKKSNRLITNDSDYFKTTVIKEYYTDEFDFSSSDTLLNISKPNYESSPAIINPAPLSNLSIHNKPGGLNYRETTIIEKGKVRIVNGKSKATATVISSNKKENNKTTATILHTETKSQKETYKSSVSILTGLSLLLLLVLISLFIYSKYKKLTIWQVLKQLIKL